MIDGVLVPGLVAAVLAGIAVLALLRWRDSLPLATPNARTLHETPIPRVGGLALWTGFLPVAFASASVPSMTPSTWVVPLAALLLVSLRDDARAVSITVRIAVHLAAAAWFAFALVGASASALPVVALIVLIVAWSLNLYNFMDGSDGLAALMAVAGFGAYGIVLGHAGLPAAMPMAMAAAALPVLAVNLPPAKMFLGDVGAVPLGFLAAATGIAGVVDGLWPAWFPILVFLAFIADASVTLVRRALARERFWEAHKSHYYQRLHRMGAGHAGTLAIYGALMAATAGTAVLCACLKPEWGAPALAAWCAVFAALFAAIDYHWGRSTR